MLGKVRGGFWWALTGAVGEAGAVENLQMALHQAIHGELASLTKAANGLIAWLTVVLDGELAVPCTRNPLQRD